MPATYGKWEIVRSLSEGGQARTFIVKNIEDGSENWVLKRLKNDGRIGRFEQEIETLRQLQHARIPRIVDHALGDPAYFVTPYLGTTLDKVIPSQQLPLDEIIDLFRDVVEAVEAAHANGIVHRDIKPNNVVVGEEEGVRRAYLIDFGVCQWANGPLYVTDVREAFGNRNFAAPECELGSLEEPSERSDVYSLGKLLYWMVTGGGFFPREQFQRGPLDRIPQPRGVERAYIRRWLEATVTESTRKRIKATVLLDRVERDMKLMRLGVNAVGAREQLCPVCRLGTMSRRKDLGNLGFNAVGNPPAEVRLLHCQYCGYLQHHYIGETESEAQDLWEI